MLNADCVNEEPVLLDSFLVEEESGTSVGTFKKVGGKGCNPFKNGKASATLQDKKSNGLLEE